MDEGDLKVPSELRDTRLDAALAAADVLATVPGLSTVLAPVLAVLRLWLPSQTGRVVDFAKRVHERVSKLESGFDGLQRFVHDDASRVLFDRIVDQVRISTDDRRRRLANLLATCLSEEEVRFNRVEKLVHTLAQLTDADVMRLYYHSQQFSLTSSLLGRFCDKYPDIGEPPSPELHLDQPGRDHRALFYTYDHTLIAFGLILDKRGGYHITEFGELLLRYILDEEDETWKQG